MNKILSAVTVTIFIISCSSGDSTKNGLPEKPGSVKAVQEKVKGKKYTTDKVGTHSLFSKDTTIQWLEPKKEEGFEKKIVDESKTFQLNFVNDTSVTVVMKDKTYNGTYIVNDTTKEDEKSGIKLQISYVDEEFRLGEGAAPMVTYSYIVEGIDDKSLLLQTPRTVNDRKIVVLMNKQ